MMIYSYLYAVGRHVKFVREGEEFLVLWMKKKTLEDPHGMKEH